MYCTMLFSAKILPKFAKSICMSEKTKIIQPQAGFQEQFVSTNLDFVLGGGGLGTGKSYAAGLSIADAVWDGRFRGLFLRNNLGDARAAGGLLDTLRDIYGSYVEIVESGEPRATFPSGARIDVTHVSRICLIASYKFSESPSSSVYIGSPFSSNSISSSS